MWRDPEKPKRDPSSKVTEVLHVSDMTGAFFLARINFNPSIDK